MKAFLVMIFGLVGCAHKAVTAPAPAPVSETVVEVTPPPAPVEEEKVVRPVSRTWVLNKGRLSGQPKGSKISSTETCWAYSGFAIVEMRAEGEIGAAEINIRRGSGDLCARNFPGARIKNLRAIEGFFAGVVGDLIVVDGADASEGWLDFQVLDSADGKELFRSRHHPREPVRFVQENERTSVEFAGRVRTSCDLAEPDCWKSTLAANKIKVALAKPVCKGVPKGEPGLVSAPVVVSDLRAPQPRFVRGRVTCEPEP